MILGVLIIVLGGFALMSFALGIHLALDVSIEWVFTLILTFIASLMLGTLIYLFFD